MGCGQSAHQILEPKGRKIIMLGGEGSGKTSVLYWLTKKMEVCAIPTVGHNAEFLEIKKEKFVLYDIGGRNVDLSQIYHLLESAIAVVYMIDASNNNIQLFKEAINLFTLVISNPQLQGLPIAICLNKQDISDNIYVDEEVVLKNFPINQLQPNQYKFFKTSYKSKTNIQEPFDWIQSLKLKPSMAKKPPRSPKKPTGSSYGLPISTEQPQSNGSKAFPETQDI